MEDDLLTADADEQAYMDAARDGKEPVEQKTDPEPEPRDDADAGPEPGDDDEPKRSPPPKGYVEHGAFHQERERRKAVQRELEEYRQRTETRLMQLLEAREAKPEAKAPSIEDDPAGYLNHEISGLKQTVQKFQETEAQQRERMELDGFITASVREYAAEKPDFQDAATFLEQSKIKEYQATGMTLAQAQSAVLEEAHRVAKMARQRGDNFGEVAYRMAEARGYAPKQAGEPLSEPDKFETLERGAKAAAKGGSGAAPTNRMNAKELEKFLETATDEEWNKFVESGEDRKYFG